MRFLPFNFFIVDIFFGLPHSTTLGYYFRNAHTLFAKKNHAFDAWSKDLSIKLFNFKVFSKLVMPSAVLHRHPSAPTYNYLNPFQRALPRSWS